MDDEGNIFDLVHIVPYIKKYKRNPVTGKKLEPSQLVKLNIHKNSKGEMHCPVMFKVTEGIFSFIINCAVGCPKLSGFLDSQFFVFYFMRES